MGALLSTAGTSPMYARHSARVIHCMVEMERKLDAPSFGREWFDQNGWVYPATPTFEWAMSLHVGAFRLASTDLERGEVIRRGDRVRVFWTLDENQILDCELEIEGEGIGRRFKTGKMFTQQGAQKNFEGKEGEVLARTVLDKAQVELNEL